MKKYQQIKLLRISKRSFHYARTRNFAVKKAKGKYILFISADALPVNKRMLDYINEDFNLSKRVQAVFCPHIPYKKTKIIQKLEVICYFERLKKYVNSNGLLIQDIKNPFIPYTKKNEFVWYMLSNTCAAYKRKFILKNPFLNINYGEDLAMGKYLIEKRFIKIYDTRFKVIHSHIFSLKEYYQREKEFIFSSKYQLKLKKSSNFICKLKKIISMQHTVFFKKIYFVMSLFFYYAIKIIILLHINYENLARHSYARSKTNR